MTEEGRDKGALLVAGGGLWYIFFSLQASGALILYREHGADTSLAENPEARTVEVAALQNRHLTLSNLLCFQLQ